MRSTLSPRRLCLLPLLVGALACGDDAAPAMDSSISNDARALGDAADARDAIADASGADEALADQRADDAEADSGGEPDAGEPGRVEALVLTGHLGRRMLSCDRGASFVYDISVDDDARCWNMAGGEGPDCDHHPTSNNGVAFGNGAFITTAGWGSVEDDEGGLFLSNGSSDWRQREPGTTFNGVSFGNGVFVANGGEARISRDGGESWTAQRLDFRPSRGAYFYAGRHVLLRDQPGEVWISEDDGDTFAQPEDASDCAFEGGMGGVGGNDSLLIYSNRADRVCASTDGGRTWTGADLPENLASNLVFDGEAFLAVGRDTRYRSVDGLEWAEEASDVPRDLRRIRRFDDGTLIGVVNAWGGFYERSGLYLSEDGGLTWTATAASDALNGHPIRGAAVGSVDASLCE
ncbi:MAG: hypothetical protein AAF645_14710 [Myxococcota bacterium]